MARALPSLEGVPVPRYRWIRTCFEAALVAHRRRGRLLVLTGAQWPEERHNALRNRGFITR